MKKASQDIELIEACNRVSTLLDTVRIEAFKVAKTANKLILSKDIERVRTLIEQIEQADYNLTDSLILLKEAADHYEAITRKEETHR